jgi:C-1 hydroxylase
MTSDDNKALVRRFFELLNEGKTEAIPEFFDPNFQLHFDSMPALDGAGAVGFMSSFLDAFPGLQHTLHDQIAENDRVASRISLHGTHRGELMGMPPTGREVAFSAINIHRMVNGKIVEQWVNSDGLGMLQQLGALAPPVATG